MAINRISGSKSPALNGLKLENRLRRGPRKGLESALRIGKGQPHHHAADSVETAPEELPVKWLAVDLASALKPARANGDVGAIGDGGKQAVGLFHRCREIGIGKHDNVALRLRIPSRTL